MSSVSDIQPTTNRSKAVAAAVAVALWTGLTTPSTARAKKMVR